MIVERAVSRSSSAKWQSCRQIYKQIRWILGRLVVFRRSLVHTWVWKRKDDLLIVDYYDLVFLTTVNPRTDLLPVFREEKATWKLWYSERQRRGI